MTIEMNSVKSSNISQIGYDPKEKTLAVEFSDGSLYHYHNVDRSCYEELLTAKSVGGHFHKEIKRSYKFTKQDKSD